MLQAVLCCAIPACLSVQTPVRQGSAWLFIYFLWCVNSFFQILFCMYTNICFDHASGGPVLFNSGLSECTDAGSTGTCLAVLCIYFMCNVDSFRNLLILRSFRSFRWSCVDGLCWSWPNYFMFTSVISLSVSRCLTECNSNDRSLISIYEFAFSDPSHHHWTILKSDFSWIPYNVPLNVTLR